MRNIFCLILIVTSVTVSFCQIKDNNALVFEVTLKSFGKCKPLPDEFFVITGLKRENVTSVLYVTTNNATDVIAVPINDKVFNYDYFYKYIYSPDISGKQIKLTAKEFEVNNEKIYVACKMQ